MEEGFRVGVSGQVHSVYERLLVAYIVPKTVSYMKNIAKCICCEGVVAMVFCCGSFTEILCCRTSPAIEFHSGK